MVPAEHADSDAAEKSSRGQRGVAVAAAGSVLRGPLQIGRAMAAAVALVGLLGAELLVLRGARAIWSGFRPGSASRPSARR